MSLSLAQTITLSPKMPSAPLGTTVQFTAAVSGLSNMAVKWSAGVAVGGNASAGFISNSGLYTAPSRMPGQNPVQIVATSVSNPSPKVSTYVYLLTAGPRLHLYRRIRCHGDLYSHRSRHRIQVWSDDQ